MKVRSDIKNNLLIIIFSGKLDAKNLEKIYSDIRFNVADLDIGFRAVADYSGCNVISLDSLPVLKKIMAFLLEKGMNEVVRVVDEKLVSHSQFQHINTCIQGYKPIYAHSLEEAIYKLKNYSQRGALRILVHNHTIKCIYNENELIGNIIDISLSGCSFDLVEEFDFICENDHIDLFFEMKINRETVEQFSVPAVVVRHAASVYGVTFQQMTEEDKKRLIRCILFQMRDV